MKGLLNAEEARDWNDSTLSERPQLATEGQERFRPQVLLSLRFRRPMTEVGEKSQQRLGFQRFRCLRQRPRHFHDFHILRTIPPFGKDSVTRSVTETGRERAYRDEMHSL